VISFHTKILGNVGTGTTLLVRKLNVAGSICLSGANCISSWPVVASPASEPSNDDQRTKPPTEEEASLCPAKEFA